MATAVKIDLDAARAARAEKTPKSSTPKVVFHGKRFPLPAELPFGVFLRLGQLDDKVEDELALEIMAETVETLFGARANEFLALGPSIDDLMTLMAALVDGYNLDPKAQAQPKST